MARDRGGATEPMRGWVTLAILVVFAALAVMFGGLRFPIGDTDEAHFWPTSQGFSDPWPPTIERIRSYPELSTPLSFITFGTLEAWFGGGIVVGRWLNLALGLGIALVIAHAPGSGTPFDARRAVLSLVGLLAFPYYLGVCVHLYTDTMAAVWVLLALWAYRRRRRKIVALALAFGIATRQYMIAFAAALAIHAWFEHRSDRALVGAPLVGGATFVIWWLLFGGPAPVAEIARQHIDTSRWHPAHGLYFLALVGLYFVTVESILERRLVGWSRTNAWQKIVIALLMAVAFSIDAPLANRDYSIPAMGYFDRVLRAVLSDLPRVFVFWGFATLCVIRFARFELASLLVYANAVMMVKAHIGWDKYALPLLVCLWFLVRERAMAADSAPIVAAVRE